MKLLLYSLNRSDFDNNLFILYSYGNMTIRKIPVRLFLILGIMILVGIGGFYLYQQRKIPSNITSPLSEKPIAVKTKTGEELLSWQDPLGFYFSYPASVKVTSNEKDNEHYANLELTAKDYGGGVSVLVADASFPSLEKWLEALNLPLKASILDTEITATVSAKKIYNLKTDTTTTIFFYDDLAYTIATKEKSDSYWKDVQKSVVDTFILPSPWEETLKQGMGESAEGDGEAVDEEETVE